MHTNSRSRVEPCASPHELFTSNYIWENCAAHQNHSDGQHSLASFEPQQESTRPNGGRISGMWRDDISHPRNEDGLDAFLTDPHQPHPHPHHHHHSHDSCPHMLWNDNLDASIHQKMPSDLTPPPEASEPISPYSGDWAIDEHSQQGHGFSSSNQSALSPVLDSILSSTKGDGVRKKNAKIDIPKNRTLQNLDNLIKEANKMNDHASEKELKQQKRLLRNREAALHSRQKKKEHTARLEEEKKQYQTEIRVLNQQIDELRKQVEDEKRQKERLGRSGNNAKNQAEQHPSLRKGTTSCRRNYGFPQSLSSSTEQSSETNTSSSSSEWDKDVDPLSEFSLDGIIHLSDIDDFDQRSTLEEDAAAGRKDMCFFLLYYGAYVASGRSSATNLPVQPLPTKIVELAQQLSNKMLGGSLSTHAEQNLRSQVNGSKNGYTFDKSDTPTMFTGSQQWANNEQSQDVELLLQDLPSVTPNGGDSQLDKAFRDLFTRKRSIKSES